MPSYLSNSPGQLNKEKTSLLNRNNYDKYNAKVNEFVKLTA